MVFRLLLSLIISLYCFALPCGAMDFNEGTDDVYNNYYTGTSSPTPKTLSLEEAKERFDSAIWFLSPSSIRGQGEHEKRMRES